MRSPYVLSLLVTMLLATVRPAQLASAQTPPLAESRSVEERLALLEDKLQRLEKRIDAATQNTATNSENHEGGSAESLEALDQKVRVLERNRELDQENALLKAKEAPAISAGPDGFSISSADKSYRLKVGGYAQADGRTFYDDHTHALIGGLIVRRARLNFDGSVGKYVDFRLAPEFGNGSLSLYDAYADLRFQPYAVLRGGKFKAPLGLEWLANATELTLIERSLVSDLLPNRDVGFQLYGNLGGRFAYQAAVLDGAPDGTNIDTDTNKGKDVVGRIFFTPFAKSGPAMLSGLGFGLGVSSGRQNGALPTYKSTGGQVAFFSYLAAAQANGGRVRYSPQLYYYNGPFGLMGEYAEEDQAVSSAAGGKHELSTHAWQVTGSWVITGEKKSYRGVVPRKAPPDRKLGPWLGAWEVAGRYTELNVDPAAFTLSFADPTKSAEAARAWAVGVNWYLNRNVKLAADYVQTHFEKGGPLSAGVVTNRPTEKTFLQRVQFLF